MMLIFVVSSFALLWRAVKGSGNAHDQQCGTDGNGESSNNPFQFRMVQAQVSQLAPSTRSHWPNGNTRVTTTNQLYDSSKYEHFEYLNRTGDIEARFRLRSCGISICARYVLGTCRHGDECMYLHEPEECSYPSGMRPDWYYNLISRGYNPSAYCTQFCSATFKNRICRFGMFCPYAHELEERRHFSMPICSKSSACNVPIPESFMNDYTAYKLTKHYELNAINGCPPLYVQAHFSVYQNDSDVRHDRSDDILEAWPHHSEIINAQPLLIQLVDQKENALTNVLCDVKCQTRINDDCVSSFPIAELEHSITGNVVHDAATNDKVVAEHQGPFNCFIDSNIHDSSAESDTNTGKPHSAPEWVDKKKTILFIDQPLDGAYANDCMQELDEDALAEIAQIDDAYGITAIFDY